MSSDVSNIGPFTGENFNWGLKDSIANKLGLNSPSKSPNVELAKEAAKRAIGFSSDYIVPEILGGYSSPLAYLGMPTKAALGLGYSTISILAHGLLAGKNHFDGDRIERNNHLKSAAKFGSRIVADGAFFGVTIALGTPAILAVSLANLIAPKQLREGTEKAFQFIDAKIGRLESRGISHAEAQTDDIVFDLSAILVKKGIKKIKDAGLLTLGADGKMRVASSDAEALSAPSGRGKRTRR